MGGAAVAAMEGWWCSYSSSGGGVRVEVGLVIVILITYKFSWISNNVAT